MGSFDPKEILTGLVLIVAGGFGHWLWTTISEWRKRIICEVDNWHIDYLAEKRDNSGGIVVIDEPREGASADYKFNIRFFNKKSKAIGLHKFSLQFTSELRQRPNFEHEDSALWHGPVSHGSFGYRQDDLRELTLMPHDWTPDNIKGHSEPEETKAIARSNAVRLAAHTTEGRKRYWHVATLKPKGKMK